MVAVQRGLLVVHPRRGVGHVHEDRARVVRGAVEQLLEVRGVVVGLNDRIVDRSARDVDPPHDVGVDGRQRIEIDARDAVAHVGLDGIALQLLVGFLRLLVAHLGRKEQAARNEQEHDADHDQDDRQHGDPALAAHGRSCMLGRLIFCGNGLACGRWHRARSGPRRLGRRRARSGPRGLRGGPGARAGRVLRRGDRSAEAFKGGGARRLLGQPGERLAGKRRGLLRVDRRGGRGLLRLLSGMRNGRRRLRTRRDGRRVWPRKPRAGGTRHGIRGGRLVADGPCGSEALARRALDMLLEHGFTRGRRKPLARGAPGAMRSLLLGSMRGGRREVRAGGDHPRAQPGSGGRIVPRSARRRCRMVVPSLVRSHLPRLLALHPRPSRACYASAISRLRFSTTARYSGIVAPRICVA